MTDPRIFLTLALPFLVAASMSKLDVNKGVELVNAAPSDFRAILAVMFLLLFIQTIERFWAGFRAGKTADKFAGAADKVSEAVNTMAVEHALSTLAIDREMQRLVAEVRDLAKASK